MGKEKRNQSIQTFQLFMGEKDAVSSLFPSLGIFTFMIIINAIKQKIRIRETVLLKEQAKSSPCELYMISFLENLCKLNEKLMTKRMLSKVAKHKINYKTSVVLCCSPKKSI